MVQAALIGKCNSESGRGLIADLRSCRENLPIIVVVLFFATSSDSGSLVIDILTNGGDPNPKWQQRLFWAVLVGVVAAVLLLYRVRRVLWNREIAPVVAR